ncbi:Sec14 cytosolic factor [Sesamum alatum]|uniref:Sec14 cytosolic factor n=1 Tax=Sesamum alatum TaxID=300844 RepID=A0AAE1YUI6_9LAMI|nr:Sec14 cytosolic factor [Sesamum alatum]
MEEEEEEIFHSPEAERDEKADDEKRKLRLMRATLEAKDLSCKDTDDLTLRRFLRARDLDVEKASTMFMKYLAWRRTFVPKGYISESEITNDIAQNKMFMQGRDKAGRPIAVVFGSRHFASKGGVDEFRRFLVFALDRLCSRIPDGQEKFTIIGDIQGYGYCNSDVRGVLAAISILQEYYPERLGKVYVIHVPYIFMTLWKIVSPFIDKNTRKKIVFVENKRLRATLLEDIDESQLPEVYGGKLQLIPIQSG